MLVGYWAKDAIRVEQSMFWGQYYGGSEIRKMNFDWNRVNEIREVLGNVVTRAAVEDAYQEAAQDYGHNDWIMFCYGTHEEQVAHQEWAGRVLETLTTVAQKSLAAQVVESVSGRNRETTDKPS